MLFDVGDPRLPRLDAARLEAIRNSEEGFERGFYIAPEPRESATPVAGGSSSRTTAHPLHEHGARPSPSPASRAKVPGSRDPAVKLVRKVSSQRGPKSGSKRRSATK